MHLRRQSADDEGETKMDEDECEYRQWQCGCLVDWDGTKIMECEMHRIQRAGSKAERRADVWARAALKHEEEAGLEYRQTQTKSRKS
jgi:hypothetical protein